MRLQVQCGAHSLPVAEAWRGAGDGACPLPTVVSPWKVVEDYVLNEWPASDRLLRSSINQRKSLTAGGWVLAGWVGVPRSGV